MRNREKALPLNGGGLGGGVYLPSKDMARLAPTSTSSPKPPLNGTGVFEHDAHSTGAVQRARRMRSDMTASEKKLWAVLRKLNLGFRRQAPIGRYVADFAQHSLKLVVEVDGGCHDLPDAQLRDTARDAWLQSQGYRVVRVRDELAYADPWSVAETVKSLIGHDRAGAAAPNFGSAFGRLPTPPSPTLPPSRGKGEGAS